MTLAIRAPTPSAPVDPSGGGVCPCAGVLGLLGMVVVLGWRTLARCGFL